MKETRWIDKFRANLIAKPPEDYDQAIREVKPFYWFLIAGLVIQYGFTVYFFAASWEFSRIIWFTGLMILHGILHWLSPHLTYKTMLAPFYVIVQSGMALTLVLVSDSYSLSYGLFAPLLGEILGMFRFSRKSFLYSVFILVVSFLSYLIARDMAVPWEWIVTAIPIAIFVWLYVSSYTKQVLAREEAHELLTELEGAHQQLSEYAAQVENLTLATERQRMARELHDTLAQGLAGLILQLEAADSHISSDHHEKAQGIIQQAMGRARTTLADARRAIGDLRDTQSPTDLADDIRQEAERFSHDTGIPCGLDLCVPETLPYEVAENTLRAVSEGLINVARHAGATQASVGMKCGDQYLEVSIHDNGIGFDPDECVGKSGHYGLLGMRERARILGGSLVIESDSSRGSILRLELPLNNEYD